MLQESGKVDYEWLNRTNSMAKELQTAILDQIKSWTEGSQSLEKQWQQGLGRVFLMMLTDVSFPLTPSSLLSELEPSQKHTLLSDWLVAEMENLRTSYQQEQTYLRTLKQDTGLLSQHYDDQARRAKSVTEDLEKSALALDDCTMALMQTEKRHDRSKSQVIASLASGGLDGLTVDALDGSPIPTTPTTTTATTTTTESSTVTPMTGVEPTPPVSTASVRGYSDSDIVVSGSVNNTTIIEKQMGDSCITHISFSFYIAWFHRGPNFEITTFRTPANHRHTQ